MKKHILLVIFALFSFSPECSLSLIFKETLSNKIVSHCFCRGRTHLFIRDLFPHGFPRRLLAGSYGSYDKRKSLYIHACKW